MQKKVERTPKQRWKEEAFIEPKTDAEEVLAPRCCKGEKCFTKGLDEFLEIQATFAQN